MMKTIFLFYYYLSISDHLFFGSLQGKAVNSTREWTEQETLLLLEVRPTGQKRRDLLKYSIE